MRSALLLLALLCACGPRPAQRSALLITLDTTRADALSCYGNPRATTPQLDRLAAEGLLFEQAHTCVPLTLPAHASMLTGLYPPRHGLHDNGVAALPGEAHTLAEVAREAGCQTAAFVASVVLSARFGLDQGFESYSSPRRAPAGIAQPAHGGELRAGEVVDRALAWFEERDPERPFFVWVHLYDAHHPYAPPPGFDATRWEGNPYLAEVAYADHELGRLLDRLREEGTLDETTVLVVADHGEAFGEHGELTHGALCYEPTLHVPLLLRRPADPRAGERIAEPVSVVDVLPTLVEALGLSLPADLADVDGRVLPGAEPGALPAGAGPALYFESYYGYLSYGWSPLTGALSGGGKYLHSSSPQYFDLARDPAEARDLLAEHPAEAERGRQTIAQMWSRQALSSPPAPEADEELEQAIRALGYAGAAQDGAGLADPLAPSERPAPHLRASFFARQARAQELERGGRLDEAIEVYRGILGENPGNAAAREEIGRLLLLAERPDEAVSTLEQLVATAHPQARHFFGLGSALVAAGRLEDALAPLERAVAMSQGRPHYVELLASTLRGLGREQEARGLLRDLQAGQDPD